MPEHRTMVFVDGENFAIRGQEVLKAWVGEHQTGPFYEPSTFLWIPSSNQGRQLGWYGFNQDLFPPALRSYYFTALKSGNENNVEDVTDKLKALDFDPYVFTTKKTGGGRSAASKLVDQSLTVKALHHAYQDHYDSALILSGDSDYVPLIEELKSMGKRVHVAFFGDVVLDSIRRAGDRFIDITAKFEMGWKLFREQQKILYIFQGVAHGVEYDMQGYEVKPHIQ